MNSLQCVCVNLIQISLKVFSLLVKLKMTLLAMAIKRVNDAAMQYLKINNFLICDKERKNAIICLSLF